MGRPKPTQAATWKAAAMNTSTRHDQAVALANLQGCEIDLTAAQHARGRCGADYPEHAAAARTSWPNCWPMPWPSHDG